MESINIWRISKTIGELLKIYCCICGQLKRYVITILMLWSSESVSARTFMCLDKVCLSHKFFWALPIIFIISCMSCKCYLFKHTSWGWARIQFSVQVTLDLTANKLGLSCTKRGTILLCSILRIAQFTEMWLYKIQDSTFNPKIQINPRN